MIVTGWMVFDHCRIVLDTGVYKRIQHHPTMLHLVSVPGPMILIMHAKILDDVG